MAKERRMPPTPPTLPGILTGILTGALIATSVTGLLSVESGDGTAAVLVQAGSTEEAAAIVAAHGGEVSLELGIIDGVAAAVPSGMVDDLAVADGVEGLTPDVQVSFAETERTPEMAAADATSAAAVAEEAAQRAKEAREAAKKLRELTEDVAKSGDVEATVLAEADVIGAGAAATAAAESAARGAEIAAAARDELEPSKDDALVEPFFKQAKDAAKHADEDAVAAAEEARRAQDEVRKAAEAVVAAQAKADKLAAELAAAQAKLEEEQAKAAAELAEAEAKAAAELEAQRVKLAQERAEDARKAESDALGDALGITPHDALALIGGSWLERKGYDGSGVDIAIVDSGVADLGHFQDRVERPIDLSGLPESKRDGKGHGTAMASIAALHDGGDSGVADDAGIVDVKVASRGAVTDVSQVIAAIDWVVANRNTGGRNIRVLSLSFGTDGTLAYTDSPLALAVEAAWAHGIVVVVAAGNHGSELGRLATPAIDPYVIAVGAVDLKETVAPTDDVVPSWSARGDGVRNPDVLAPGVSMLAEVHKESDAVKQNSNRFKDGMLPGSGTSQATAFTAGVVAALLEAQPSLSPDEVKALLTSTARPLAGADARAAGNGVIDLDAIAETWFVDRDFATARGARQSFGRSNGQGGLDGDRGRFKVRLSDGEVIDGDETPFGTFDAAQWAGSTWTGSTWTGSTWTGSTWTGSTWTGSTWTGSTWTGSTWTGSTWTGSTWTGSAWTDSTWTTIGWR